MTNLTIYQGDCLDEMEWMPDETVQCCVTSPPYFGLRDYGVNGQIGLEQTPEEYVRKMVIVFREVRRVMKSDGTLWLNIGDSYSSGGNGVGTGKQLTNVGSHIPARKAPPGYKSKDLIGIPWMVAFALRNDGWYLRQDIIWRKPNPMPESVRDRCTKAHEYIFLMSKSAQYYFDHEAIKEPAVGQNKHDLTGPAYKAPGQSAHTGSRSKKDSTHCEKYDTPMRNRRSVWDVATRPYKGAHFATYPPRLIEPCILAGSRRNDVVFDPFGGSGTTAAVALRCGRRAVTCELNPEYIKLIKQRTSDAMIDYDEEL